MNRVNFSLWMAVGLCVALAACSDGGRRRGGGGPVVMVDGGGGGGTDLGGGGGTDLGGGGGTDLGPGRDLGGPMVDLGRDLGSSCTPTPVGYITGAYCSAATQICIDGCTTGACLSDCLDADPSADCGGCANQNLIACANMNGCVSQWNAFDCCFQANCTDSTDPNCVTNFCPSQRDAFTTCANGVLPTATCTEDYTSCF